MVAILLLAYWGWSFDLNVKGPLLITINNISNVIQGVNLSHFVCARTKGTLCWFYYKIRLNPLKLIITVTYEISCYCYFRLQTFKLGWARKNSCVEISQTSAYFITNYEKLVLVLFVNSFVNFYLWYYAYDEHNKHILPGVLFSS